MIKSLGVIFILSCFPSKLTSWLEEASFLPINWPNRPINYPPESLHELEADPGGPASAEPLQPVYKDPFTSTHHSICSHQHKAEGSGWMVVHSNWTLYEHFQDINSLKTCVYLRLEMSLQSGHTLPGRPWWLITRYCLHTEPTAAPQWKEGCMFLLSDPSEQSLFLWLIRGF